LSENIHSLYSKAWKTNKASKEDDQAQEKKRKEEITSQEKRNQEAGLVELRKLHNKEHRM